MDGGSQLFGFDELKAKFQAILDSRKAALKAAGVSLLKSAQDSIINGDGAWPAWSAAYAKRVAKKRAHQMLWDSGTLLRSLTPGGDENVFDFESDNKLTVGSNVKYAARQNFGGNGVPARAYLFVDADRLNEARDAFVAQLVRSLK